MASFSSLGIGSGLDLNTLLEGLVKVERQPITLLQKQQSGLKSQLSAIGQVKSALSSLQSASDALKTTASFAAFKATSSDSSVASATASTGAVGGSYDVEVTQLAQAQKLKFAFDAGKTFSGTMNLELGKPITTGDGFAETKSASISVEGLSLAGVRDAVNAAGLGITATIVNDGSGTTPFKLILTSQQGGADNQIRSTGVADLAFGYSGTSVAAGDASKVITSAQNAQFSIDGIAMERSSNKVSDAIDGITLNLAKETTGTPVKISIDKDADAVATKINAFVKAYNDLNKVLRDTSSYNADTKVAGALNGDFSVRTVQERMRSAAIGSVAGSPGGFGRLPDVGISFEADGTLKVDSDKLKAAIADPAKDISKLFTGITGTEGIATRVSSAAAALLNTEGVITTRTDGINKTISALDKRIGEVEARVAIVEERYRRQFTALDTTIGQMNVTSAYLQQQLARLPK
ncbi:flagellar filament capping protein FliD [Niveibacterium sp. 24ML]|uniref:flagellar filament capping protein FliD n=1 Tax=Niveibacterium sp. 24ML TaxID=2985512 RepID=UPI00226ECCC6|nr:flagellar filament capping protein FliD [Niveibacterium sp. 24ML]MCX9156147.1 flagellar filament capping protein FliD [Niveibacterium sp. 24ML]